MSDKPKFIGGDPLRPRAHWEKPPMVVTSSDHNADDAVTGTQSPEARLDDAEAELAATQAELISTKAKLAAAEAKLAEAVPSPKTGE